MILYIRSIVIIFSIIFFTGCNSSAGQTSTNEYISISGVVVDGYIRDASLCLDLNNNNSCESSEPTTTSDENGSYSFTTLSTTTTQLISIISIGGVDVSTQREFQGKLRNVVQLTPKKSVDNLVLSPVTDLIVTEFLKADEKTLLSLEESKSNVSASLSVDKELLNEDPMKNLEIFSATQKIHHTQLLLKTIVEKNSGNMKNSPIKEDLEDIIKEEIINNNSNIESIITALELRVGSVIPNNEKEFVEKQLDELSESLDELLNNSSINLEELASLQNTIATTQYEANDRLKVVDGDYKLEVVALDLHNSKTTEVVSTQENLPLNTLNAIYDPNACKFFEEQKMIKNHTLSMEKSEDIQNGVSIKLNFKQNQTYQYKEVQLFYPSLTQELTNQRVTLTKADYTLSFDKAWLKNENQTIYILTPENIDGTKSCYKFTLDFENELNTYAIKVLSEEN